MLDIVRAVKHFKSGIFPATLFAIAFQLYVDFFFPIFPFWCSRRCRSVAAALPSYMWFPQNFTFSTFERNGENVVACAATIEFGRLRVSVCVCVQRWHRRTTAIATLPHIALASSMLFPSPLVFLCARCGRAFLWLRIGFGKFRLHCNK